MKRRNLRNTAIAGLAALSMLLLTVCGAGDDGAPVIDPERRASLTICKIKENSAAAFDTQGLPSSDVKNEGMQGVRFGALRIAGIEMVAGGSEAGSYFSEMEPGFLEVAERNGVTPEAKTIGGKTYYTTEAVSGALEKILASAAGGIPGEAQLAEYVRGNAGTKHTKETDAAGRTTLAELPLGLYLVAEEDHAGFMGTGGADGTPGEAIHNTSQPFLVSLPMTDQSGSQAVKWLYDVTVYPKNQTIRIPKYLLSEADGNTLLQCDDYEIGETVRQVIAPSAPAVTDQMSWRKYEKYEILDSMDKGQSFQKLVSVRLGQLVASPKKLSDFAAFTELREGVDFLLLKGAEGETLLTAANAAGTKAFRIRLLKDGLAKLNAMKYSGQLVLTFDSLVTREAEDGNAAANRNKPALTVKNGNALEYTLEGNRPEIFTYRLVIRKRGVGDATRVVFRVAREGRSLSFVREGSGVYHLFDGDLDLAEKTGATGELSPAGDGTLTLRGLDSDEYEFTEMATESGFELLRSKFTVALTGTNPVDGKLKKAELSVDGRSSAITVSEGTASFSVANYRSLILRTGGMGTKAIYAAGIAVAVAAAVLLAGVRLKGRR